MKIQTYPVQFAYPGYAPFGEDGPQFENVLNIQAQVLGDVDAVAETQVLFFTMDGKSITRKLSQHQKIKSTWEFTAVCNIEIVRNFFRRAEGQYLYYRHYDTSEWILLVTGSDFNVSASRLRSVYNGEELVTHNFNLSVDRWKYQL